MNYVPFGRAAVGVVVVVGAACGQARATTPEMETWTNYFEHLLVSGVPHPDAAEFRFSEELSNEDGSFPLGPSMAVADDSVSTRPGVVACPVEIGQEDFSRASSVASAAETCECDIAQALATTAPVAIEHARTGDLVTPMETVDQVIGHVELASRHSGSITSSGRLTVRGTSLVTGDVVVEPQPIPDAEFVANASERTRTLGAQLSDLAAGIHDYSLDRQPNPLAMLRGEMYENMTRELLASELRGSAFADVELRGLAVVYGDRVRLVTAAVSDEAVFVVDGSTGIVTGPYATGTTAESAAASSLWLQGELDQPREVLVFAAD